MANNFKTTVTDFYNTLKNDHFPMLDYENLTFATGKTEKASFRIPMKLRGKNHVKNLLTAACQVEFMDTVLNMSLHAIADNKDYEAEYDGVKIAIHIDYMPQKTFGEAMITFSFTGKAGK